MAVMVSTITTLSEYADALLQICEHSLSLTAEGVPDRVYVSPGIPAFDCQQLTLFVSGISEAPTSPLAPIEETALRGKFGRLTLATYVIDVVRCSANPVTIDIPPSPASLTAVAHIVEDDMWAIWNGVQHAVANGEIFEHCLGVHFDSVAALPDQGGFCGCTFRLRASIPGIPNT
jgi:hypothetical protein